MTILLLGILGLAFGSFITALTWRLHEKKDFVKGRSQCEHCGHTLAAKDLIPVLSWLALRGKCRYCNKPIGWQNPVIELGMAAAFIASYLLWPTDMATWQALASFAIWLVYLVLLGALLVYDFRWMLLPNALVYPLIMLAFVDAALRLSLEPNFNLFTYAQHVVLGALALGGFYALLYFASKGRWVGFGDVKLGTFIGVVVGWQLAVMTLFLANIIGFFVILPGLLLGKLNAKSRVPFGPFLIVAFIIVGLLGEQILDWYLRLILLR